MVSYPNLFAIAYGIVSASTTQGRIEAARVLALRAVQAAESGNGSGVVAEVERKYGAAAAHTVSGAIVAVRSSLTSTAREDGSVAILTAGETAEVADGMFRALKALRLEPWLYDRSIGLGQSIRRQDLRALQAASYIVLLVSRASLDSNYVDFELDVVHVLEMEDRRERLLPVIVDDLGFGGLPPWLRAIKAVRLSDVGLDGVAGAVLKRIKLDKEKEETDDGRTKRAAR